MKLTTLVGTMPLLLLLAAIVLAAKTVGLVALFAGLAVASNVKAYRLSTRKPRVPPRLWLATSCW